MANIADTNVDTTYLGYVDDNSQIRQGVAGNFFALGHHASLGNIRYPSDLANVLEKLNPKNHEAFLDLIEKEKLNALIRYPSDLANVLEKLNRENHEAFLDLIGKEKLNTLIRWPSDLAQVLKKLNPKNHEAFLDLIGKEKLNTLIRCPSDWANVLAALKPENRNAFSDAIRKEEQKMPISSSSKSRVKISLTQQIKQPNEEDLKLAKTQSNTLKNVAIGLVCITGIAIGLTAIIAAVSTSSLLLLAAGIVTLSISATEIGKQMANCLKNGFFSSSNKEKTASDSSKKDSLLAFSLSSQRHVPINYP